MADTLTTAQTQQVTSQIPVTGVKNPKRVAAAKATDEKRKQAREEQKKKLAEADAILANDKLRKAQEEARKAKEVVDQPVEDHTMAERRQHNRFPGGHLLQTRGVKGGSHQDQGSR